MVISVVPFISKFNANEMAAKVFASELKDAGQTDEGTRILIYFFWPLHILQTCA